MKPVQTFFTNNKTCYFVVAGPPQELRQTTPTDDVDRMIQSLLDGYEKKEREEERKRDEAVEERLKSDNTRDDYAPEPFSVYYEKSTHEKYVGYWKRRTRGALCQHPWPMDAD